MTELSEEFKAMMAADGIPVTEEAIAEELKKEADSAGVLINNDSRFSPLWNFFEATIQKGLMYLINYLAASVMPNLFAKTATGEWLKRHAEDVDLEYKTKQKAEGLIKFVRTDTSDELPVNKETIIQTPEISGRIYQVMTTVDAVFSPTEAEILIPVEALEAGEAYNLASGYYTVLVSDVPGITQVTNESDWLTKPGTDDETPEQLRARIKAQFQSQTKWHTNATYRSIVADFDGVEPENIFFDQTAPRGPGSANIYILFDVGTPSTDFINNINSIIQSESYHGLGDDIQVLAMPSLAVDVELTVWPESYLTADQVLQQKTDIENVIKAAFRQSDGQGRSITTTEPFDRFSFARLASEILDYVPNISSLDFVTPDVVTQMEIATLNSVTVNQGV